ncbi:hypothetical protein R1sor_004076 [Riccia sorocarpa]|uniref:Uncharacterized protein n=1 Tax=Riccia sorocarpa TaxID=122646 RepID=A0ABD3H6A2_9MARC
MSRLGNKYAGAFVLIHAVLKVLEKCKLIHLAALAIVDFSYRAALAITDGTEGVDVGSITEPDCEEIQGNVRDSQQRSQQNQVGPETPAPSVRQVDLNHTPPSSSPRPTSVPVNGRASHRPTTGLSPETRNSPEASASAQGGGAVRGQRVKRKPPAGQGELAAALRGFTDAYREAKQIKQDEEKARTQLLVDMMQLRRRDMFSE